MPVAESQTHVFFDATQIDYLAVPVLLNLRTSVVLPLAPVFEDGPAAWITCGARATLSHSLPALPEGETVCVIALYELNINKEVQDELQEGLPLTPAWLRSVLRRNEWDDAIAVGPALSLSGAQAAGQYMYAIATGHDDAHMLPIHLSPEALDVAGRSARRFRAEVQVLSLS